MLPPIQPSTLLALRSLASKVQQPYPLIRELYEEHRKVSNFTHFRYKIERAAKQPTLFVSVFYAED